jgi:tetratricopeptide (TPR) repeat protein
MAEDKIADLAQLEVGWLSQARALAEQHPDSPMAISRLAHAELVAGNEAVAGETARRALGLGLHAGDASAISSAAQVCLAVGDVEAIEADVDLLAAGRVPAVLLAQSAVMADMLDVALSRLVDQSDAAALSMRGYVLLRLHKYTEAIQSLRQAMRAGGPSPELLTNLGYAYGALGSLPKAIKATSQARTLSPASQTISFNLVSYLVRCGDHEAALAEVARLAGHHSRSPQIALARADIFASTGNNSRALTELRRARDTLRWEATSTVRCELAANIAVLEWRSGSRPRTSAIDAVRKELLRCEYRSIGIARMLAGLFARASEAAQLETVYAGLVALYDPSTLIAVAAQIAFLRRDFKTALKLAKQWAEVEPFSTDAAQTVTFLLADFAADFSGAAEFGLGALRRNPNSAMLKNNVAYALAMSGRPQEARNLLPPGENPYYSATKALVEFKLGNRDAGVAGYRHALEQAVRDGDQTLAALIAARAWLVLAEPTSLSWVETPPELEDDPRSALITVQMTQAGQRWPSLPELPAGSAPE